MARALLVAGDEDRFFADVDHMRRHLDGLCASGAEIAIDVLRAGGMSMAELEDSLSLALCSHAKEPLLLVYAGHGARGSWSIRSGHSLAYERLAPMLKARPGPVVFVNSCCYSGSVFSALEAAGVSKDRVSVIASSPGDRLSYGGMVRRVIASWDEGRSHEPLDGIFQTEYIGTVFGTKPVVTAKVRYDEKGRPERVVTIDLKDTARWWQRAWNRLKVWYCKRFPRIRPEDIIEERRWGAVLDHHFYSERDRP